ncbi:MAG: flagellar basal body rod protein FlgG, partial [Proteobacteria bacterium]|nr:flagellar basal body rod protein FlgG [Pseudomonadota bacterium]
MMRGLWAAATGMTAQQMNIDVIANNLANVNTAGFKASRVDFQDLVYQTVQEAGAAATEATQVPTGIQVGLGARYAAVQR